MEPACHRCAHLFVHTGSELLDPDLETCTAFYPLRIPQDILDGEFIHTVPHPKQNDREVLFLEIAPMRPRKK